jgi:hypothetical protein
MSRVPGIKEPDPWDMSRLLRLGGERRHEEAEGEGDEKSNQTARHESLLRSRTYGGILHGTCRGRKSNVATLDVQIHGHDSRIHQTILTEYGVIVVFGEPEH